MDETTIGLTAWLALGVGYVVSVWHLIRQSAGAARGGRDHDALDATSLHLREQALHRAR